MPSPSIAVDVRTGEHSGMGRYVRCTLGRLAAMDTGLRLVAIANPGQDLSWLPPGPHVDVLELRRPVPVYSPWEHVALPAAVKRSGCGLAHFTNFNAPWTCPVPFVVTIHDTIYLRFPWDCASAARAWYARALMRRGAQRAAHVITISEHSRRDIEELLLVPPDRITVTYCGTWAEGKMPQPGPKALHEAQARTPYVLYVGNQTPHKNVAQLAEAVQIVRRRRPQMKLLAAGKFGRHYAALVQELRSRNLTETIEFLGHVSDEMLVALYQAAAVVSTASLYEGFGLPVVEAFAAGAPVVASDQSSLPEVAGEAAVLADPRDPAAFARAIESVLDDAALRERLIEAGRARARLFTWDRVAQRLAQVYHRALP